jgi:chemotaxis protein methyltransferase CheR
VTLSSPFCESLIFDPAFTRLKAYLIESTGLAYYCDKDSDLAVRISRRLSKICVRDCNSYLELLKESEKGDVELDELIAELTIGETYFFRYREQFEALRSTIFPDIIARNQASRRLRIWSAGCATGAEAYSIAILLKRELSASLAGWDVSITGTDINRGFLGRAREGKFDEWAFRSTPDEVRRTCFQRAGDSWFISSEYKDGVGFQYHNLVKHPFPSLLNNLCFFDLILCRNAMIYFSRDIMRGLITQFHQCLVDGGWLLVGHAEPNPELFKSFQTIIIPGTTLYRKGRELEYPVGLCEMECYSPSIDLQELAMVPNSASEAPAEQLAKADNATSTATLQLSDVRLLADQGDWEAAARCSLKLLETDGLNPKVHFYYSLVLEQMGLHSDAEQSLRRAIYLDRAFVLAHYYLGLILQKRGDRRGAIRSFENVGNIVRTMDVGLVFADADEITAVDLLNLTETHLEVLRRS